MQSVQIKPTIFEDGVDGYTYVNYPEQTQGTVWNKFTPGTLTYLLLADGFYLLYSFKETCSETVAEQTIADILSGLKASANNKSAKIIQSGKASYVENESALGGTFKIGDVAVSYLTSVESKTFSISTPFGNYYPFFLLNDINEQNGADTSRVMHLTNAIVDYQVNDRFNELKSRNVL